MESPSTRNQAIAEALVEHDDSFLSSVFSGFNRYEPNKPITVFYTFAYKFLPETVLQKAKRLGISALDKKQQRSVKKVIKATFAENGVAGELFNFVKIKESLSSEQAVAKHPYIVFCSKEVVESADMYFDLKNHPSIRIIGISPKHFEKTTSPSLGARTFLHEILHALGLKHPYDKPYFGEGTTLTNPDKEDMLLSDSVMVQSFVPKEVVDCVENEISLCSETRKANDPITGLEMTVNFDPKSEVFCAEGLMDGNPDFICAKSNTPYFSPMFHRCASKCFPKGIEKLSEADVIALKVRYDEIIQDKDIMYEYPLNDEGHIEIKSYTFNDGGSKKLSRGLRKRCTNSTRMNEQLVSTQIVQEEYHNSSRYTEIGAKFLEGATNAAKLGFVGGFTTKFLTELGMEKSKAKHIASATNSIIMLYEDRFGVNGVIAATLYTLFNEMPESRITNILLGSVQTLSQIPEATTNPLGWASRLVGSCIGGSLGKYAGEEFGKFCGETVNAGLSYLPNPVHLKYKTN